MPNKFTPVLGITADGKSILKSDRNSSGLLVAPAASGKTTSVVLPTLTASTAKFITAEELLSTTKNATHPNVLEVNNGRRNQYFRMSPRQETQTGVSSLAENLRRKSR